LVDLGDRTDPLWPNAMFLAAHQREFDSMYEAELGYWLLGTVIRGRGAVEKRIICEFMPQRRDGFAARRTTALEWASAFCAARRSR
jgi:hypothetical protein